MMNRRAIIAIARKDIKSITANIQVWLPMFMIPIFFSVLLPIIVSFAARASKGDIAHDMQIILDMLEKLPESSLRRILDSLETDQQKICLLYTSRCV